MSTLAKPDILYSWDPGDTTGWARFNSITGQPLGEGQLTFDELLIWLREREYLRHQLTELIVEDFALFQHRAIQQSGSKFVAVQVIGALKYWAHGYCPVIMQPPTIKKAAQAWSKRKPVGKHAASHSVDAYNHGFYYLHQQGKIKTKLQEKLDDDARGKTSG